MLATPLRKLSAQRSLTRKSCQLQFVFRHVRQTVWFSSLPGLTGDDAWHRTSRCAIGRLVFPPILPPERRPLLSDIH